MKQHTGTPGGNRIRALREFAGRTQMDVELDASLGIGYLQRVESGKVRYPERDTLERILAALHAHYTERSDILELFGYVVDTPLPDQAEIQWAVDLCQSELDGAVFPAYLLDCAHRVLTWNAFVPRLFPIAAFTSRSPAQQPSMVKMLFSPADGITGRIANPELFFPAQIRVMRYQIRLFRGESWFDSLIDDLRANCPLFEHYWTNSPSQPVYEFLAGRPLVPLAITLPDGQILRFRLTSESFAQDRRFRIIYYIPADAATIQQCVQWHESGTAGT